jgi:hypothetical protein
MKKPEDELHVYCAPACRFALRIQRADGLTELSLPTGIHIMEGLNGGLELQVRLLGPWGVSLHLTAEQTGCLIGKLAAALQQWAIKAP